MPSRIELLRGFIAQRPDDPFPRYALALEYKNAGQLEEAWETFKVLMDTHRDYVPAYLHAGQTLSALGRAVEVAVCQGGGLAGLRIPSPRREGWAAALAAGSTAAMVMLAMGATAVVVSSLGLVVHGPTFLVSWLGVAAGVAALSARRA